MNFKFSITAEEFLTFQLYTLSKSENVRKKMKRGQIFATILGVILAFNLFISDALWPSIVMLLVCIAIYFYYPIYHKWRMKRNYKKYIDYAYKERFDHPEELTFHPKGVLSKNISGEGEIAKADLMELVEIEKLLLLRMKNGASIILPKKEVDEAEVKANVKKLGLPFRQELDWRY
jgi:prepilin signal peptidase PulO-like enzyme (type II secretory pathway)